MSLKNASTMNSMLSERWALRDYFLIVWDYVRYAREHDILVGPGRGSAAGSVVNLSTRHYRSRSITIRFALLNGS